MKTVHGPLLLGVLVMVRGVYASGNSTAQYNLHTYVVSVANASQSAHRVAR